MMRGFMVFIAVATFSRFDCKIINVTHKSGGPDSIIEKIILPQNETTAFFETDNLAITDERKVISPQNKTTKLEKNSTSSAVQQNKTVVEQDNLRTDRKPKTRQVPVDVLMAASSDVTNSMNADQPYYQSPLMVYPFPMMNTYYPRYFPYTYPGYQGYPFFG
ncbi:uncharacterized protein LOC113556070 [Rhopalosiphum maidis]|uniref:uncharacterized protein LOC113556070 n=1 Tax=Rhopalosiphum maidis TaxID=43146 RepID=UPI000EFE0F88|nr:uncharacterized protein LOC113556070 [Rhopalosiphum maidis]